METATIAKVGSRVYKTKRAAHNEAERSLGYAAVGGSTLDVIEHDGGHVVVYFTTTKPETAEMLLRSGHVLDVWL